MQTKIIIVFLLLLSIPLLANSDSLPTQPLFGLLLGAFGAGLLLTFTPCVLPMIPILSSIVTRGAKLVPRVTHKSHMPLATLQIVS